MTDRLGDPGPPSTVSAGDDDRISRAVRRLESALERKPGFGRATQASTTVLVDGVGCRTDEGIHRIDSDLPLALGGEGMGPTPGVLLRAALGSCLAMGYRMRAARHGVALRSIRVVVESVSEIEGMLRTESTTPPGFTQVRYHVEIETDARVEDVERIVDEGDRLSPMLDALGRANQLQRSLSIIGGVG